MGDVLLVKFNLEKNNILAKKLKKTESLREIREKLKTNFPEGVYFCFNDGAQVDENDENDFRLEDIIDDGVVHLQRKSGNEKPKDINENEKPKDIKENEKHPEKNKPIDGCRFLEKKNGLDIYLYPSAQFTDYEEQKARCLMVVGETGCGKTTLLNSFVNALLGIKIEDNFRYKIIHENFNTSQSKSQTSEVTSYNIKSVGGFPPIKIIDTPGYGDTGGIEKDKQITEKIKKVFQEQISTLNAICFVAKSSNNRLTVSQKYIFNSIMDLFGDDVKEIFVVMLTFCDGGKPNIIEPLQDKDCIFSKIIPSIKYPWYYTFNNSAIYEGNREEPFTQMFWKLGMTNFDDFKEKLLTLPRKSLFLSKVVLKERKFLEDKVEVLNKRLRFGLNKIDYLEQTMRMIVGLKGDLNDSKNFKKIIKVPKVKKLDKDPNYYATTCLICTKTCHSTCIFKDDDDKKLCCVMDSNGYCEYCPKKCHWKEHKNRDYILEDYLEDEEITLEDLKKRYCNSKNELSVKEQLFNGAKEELIKLNIECIETQSLITQSINRLRQIALNKSVFESAEEHIQLMIEIEKSEHKPGWEKRIEGLEIMRKEKKMLRELYEGSNDEIKIIRKIAGDNIQQYLNMDLNSLENKKKNCCIF